MGLWGKIKKKVKGVKEAIQKSGYQAGKKVAKVIKKPTPKPQPTITPTKKVDVSKPAVETIKAVDRPTPVSAPTPIPTPPEQKVSTRFETPPPTPKEVKVIAKPDITPTGGWKNVKDVYKIAVNPFDDNKIVATTENKVFNSVAEFVANHPYTTALMATGVISAGKTLLTPKGTLLHKYTAPTGGKKSITNAITQKLTGNSLVKSGFSLVAAGTLVAGAAGSYIFGDFQIVEALDKSGMGRWQAVKNKRHDLVEGITQFEDEMLNPTGWHYWMSKTPYLTAYHGIKKNTEAAVFTRSVWNEIIEDMSIQEENGESDVEAWERRDLKKHDQEIAAIDYYNSERQIHLKLERKAAVKGRNEDVEFHRNERAKTRKLEREEMEYIAKFWEEYRRKMQIISDNQRPSKLGFGLL